MADDPSTTRRRSLSRVVESALFFFGVASSEQFEGLLDDAEQRAMLRNWMRSAYCPHDDAVGADVSTQTEQEFLELDVAEAMVREALVIGDEGIAQEVARRVAAEERTQAAELLACQLRAELASQSELLEQARRECERERASRQAAEQRVANEQGLRRSAEKLAADAAVAQQVAEQCAAAAEQRAAAAEAVWQNGHKEHGGRRGRGGRGGRSGRGSDSSSTQQPPQPPPAPPPAAPPPPPPDLISDILDIKLAHEGSMTEEEALQILSVTHRMPRWLLSQVHPDKHLDRKAEAEAAAKRVTEARRVTEV